ncbi:MAG: thioredoxin family protein [Planctomycetes bacterium]|nr:thioredoxin family protein [Planctomycetota bacterium]
MNTLRKLAFPLVLLAFLAALFAWRNPFWAGRPEVFETGTFEQAMSKADACGRALVVDAMASWCGPCKSMDAWTWPSAKVTDWVRSNAVAFQFDVDKSPELAERFGIQAMPTVIVLKGGEEVARHSGALSAGEMVDWLEANAK